MHHGNLECSGGLVRRRAGLVARAGGSDAGGLVDFQLADGAVDGKLDATFVAVEVGEVFGAGAIDREGAGQAVVRIGRSGDGREAVGVQFAIPFVINQCFRAGVIRRGDPLETRTVDAGFEGEGTVEAPLIGGDARHEHFFGFASRAEGIVEVFEEQEEFFGIFAVKQDVFVGAQAVKEAIAAGCGLPRGATRSG